MTAFRYLLLSLSIISTLAYSQGKALNVGTESFAPPFVMQGANNELYGFDIDMMQNICRLLDRTCVFKVMHFDQLIPALVAGQIDVAVSALTITADRAKDINFSTPYALSYTRFLTKKTAQMPAFGLGIFANKTIGVLEDRIFENQIKDMGISNPTIKLYSKLHDLVEALNDGVVDFILLDNPSAEYWAANSNQFAEIGPALAYGYGLGIAVQPHNHPLLEDINRALLNYENSPEYKKDFNEYLVQF